MARRQRNQPVVISFDGLTDAVTNLTGTLILLIVLIPGITTESSPKLMGDTEPPEGIPVEPLLKRSVVLKLQIQMVDQQIQELQQSLPDLQKRLEKLQEQAEAGQSKSDQQGKSPTAPRKSSDLVPARRLVLRSEPLQGLNRE